MDRVSFTRVFTEALRGEHCFVVGLGDQPQLLPVDGWQRDADAADRAMLAHCVGPVLDIGCGPGRLTAHLARTGRFALGIDVVQEAVRQTRARGGSALARDVFDDLPAEGRWRTALLADGNIGIGGDPRGLLRRVRALLADRGRAVVELEAQGRGISTGWASLSCGDLESRRFRWSVVGVDAVDELAAAAGFTVEGVHSHGDRCWSVLRPSS